MVEIVKTVTVVRHHTTEVPYPWRPASVTEFIDILEDLTRRVDTGRVYDRDLPTLATAVTELGQSLGRRQGTSRRSR